MKKNVKLLIEVQKIKYLMNYMSGKQVINENEPIMTHNQKKLYDEPSEDDGDFHNNDDSYDVPKYLKQELAKHGISVEEHFASHDDLKLGNDSDSYTIYGKHYGGLGFEFNGEEVTIGNDFDDHDLGEPNGANKVINLEVESMENLIDYVLQFKKAGLI